MKEKSATQIAIERQFMKQYRDTEYTKITVKGLCATTPVARTTFYSYYQNIGEIKADIEDCLIEGLRQVARQCAQGDMASMDFAIFFRELLRYIRSNWDDMYSFMIVQPNSTFQNKWKEAIKIHFKMRYPKKCNAPNYSLTVEMMASAILGAYIFWLQNPEKVDVEKLNELICSSLKSITDVMD